MVAHASLFLQNSTDITKSDDRIKDEPPEETSRRLIDFEQGRVVASIHLTDAQKHLWHFDPSFDFSDNLPITRRQMKRAWRFYRRMQRLGPRTEIDVETTVEQMHRHGFMVETVLMPRRINWAKALLLIDIDEVMVPFRRITREIIASAQQSALAEVRVLYFQRVPGKIVYLDENLHRSEHLASTLSRFSDAGILIVSDGGAARVLFEDDRIEALETSLAQLRCCSPNIAWLNPFPQERWSGTPAGFVQTHLGIPMFSFSRQGLELAIDVLRGKTT